MSKWDESKISRGTKCFGSFHGTGCHGAFPKGFLKWLDKNGWLKSNRCHLCSGAIDDPGSYRVDIRPEMKPDLICDDCIDRFMLEDCCGGCGSDDIAGYTGDDVPLLAVEEK